MTHDGPPLAGTAPGADLQLQAFLASALFVVPWFAWQAWVLGTSFRQRRGKPVADANAFAGTRVAQAALAARRCEAGEAADRPDDVSTAPPTEHAIPGRSRPLLLVVGIGLLFLFSRAWLARVLAVVPEAYLDEVFHIPQAQTYCAGRYRDWDDKITTPPGLYLVSLLLRPLWAAGPASDAFDGCSVWALRGANSIAIMLVAVAACSCRAALERLDQQRRQQQQQGPHSKTNAARPESLFSLHAFHTAVNVALLPVLFFFSALYYTDVYATLTTLLAYRWYLFRQQQQQSAHAAHDSPPQWTGLVTGVLGLAALLMRQTNVFWVVVYLGGLETVQAVKAVRQQNAQALRSEVPVAAATTTTPWTLTKRYARQYALGAIHDPPVGDAWPDDWLLSLLSIAVAAVCNPAAVLLRVWPYASVLAAFAAFVRWNGGVVLGDKANHVATVHLAQLLYLWPLFVFFSAPLFVAHAAHDARRVWARLHRRTGPAAEVGAEEGRPAVTRAAQTPGGGGHQLLRLLHMLFVRKAYYPVYLVAVFDAMVAVVRYNTIVHPFTLADNRHFMFYVFRYTIRRGAVLRYALVPVYAVCAWACWRILSGPGSSEEAAAVGRDNRDFVNSPFVAFASVGSSEVESEAETPAAVAVEESTNRGNQTRSSKKASKKASKEATADSRDATATAVATPPIFLNLLDEDADAAASAAQTGAATSTALLWLLASALSLVTAPLVEPRYFILPWVFWRLLVPAVRLRDADADADAASAAATIKAATTTRGQRRPAVVLWLRRLGQKVDGRLVLETAWSVAVNAATMYVFLYRPYVWRAEDGRVLDEGRLQRFMW